MANGFLFQTFAQGENQITNNVMLLMQTLHRSSPERFANFLGALIEVEPSLLQLSFRQQINLGPAVPDGGIVQEPFTIFIETKIDGSFNVDQMRRHLKELSKRPGDSGSRYLLGISRGLPSQSEADEYKTLARGFSSNIGFCTFYQVYEEMKLHIPPHDEFMNYVINEYEQYMQSMGLYDQTSTRFPIFPTGDSFPENKEHGVYYQRIDRPSVERYNYVGLYTNKAVRALGKVECVFTARYDGGWIIEPLRGKFDEIHKTRFASVSEAVIGYHDLKSDYIRVYMMEMPVADVHISKTSKGGIMGMRYIDLNNLNGFDDNSFRLDQGESAPSVASKLNGTTFE